MKYGGVLVLIFVIIFTSSCVNIFLPFSVKDYEEANLYEAQKLLDQGRYAELLAAAEKFPPQDHVAAALGIMGFDMKIITNFLGSQRVNLETVLISWLDGSDEGYVIDLAWGLTRLSRVRGDSIQMNITFAIASSAQVMLALMILGRIANTNAIDTSDGISSEELGTLLHWLTNPIDNVTNIFTVVGWDKEGRVYRISTLMAYGALWFIRGIVSFSRSLGADVNLTEISNVISSLDDNSDGDVTETEVSNTITTFLSNLISRITN